MTERDSTRRATFVVLAAGACAFSVLQSMVLPVLATIQHDLNTSQSTVTWLLTAYLLSAAVCTPILGRVGDMVGKDRMLVVALSALALGSMLSAVAGSIGLMTAGRVIQGIGGGVMPLSFGIIRDEFPSPRVPGAVGAISALGAIGGGIGLVLAGPIDDLLGYRWLFWLSAIVTALTAVGAHLLVPRSPIRAGGRIGWPAPVLLSAWLLALLLAVNRAPHWGWGSPRVIGLAVLAAILAALWIAVESRSETPLIDMKMMRLPAVWTTNLVAFMFGVGMFVVFGFMPQFTETPTSTGYGLGASVTEAGLLILPLTLGMFVTGIALGSLTRRFGSKRILVAGSGLAILPFLFLMAAHDQGWQIIVAMTFTGFAFGISFSAIPNLIVAAVPPEQTGVANGMNANIRVIGGAIGTAVFASIVTSSAGVDGLPAESGYVSGFLMLAIAMFLALLASLLIPTVRRNPATGLEPEADLPHPELAMVAGAPLAGDDPV